jgi:Helix-turn-helix
MANKQELLQAVREAQARFEGEVGDAHDTRRKEFAELQRQGLSLRDIGDEVGLHRSRISQIINGR